MPILRRFIAACICFGLAVWLVVTSINSNPSLGATGFACALFIVLAVYVITPCPIEEDPYDDLDPSDVYTDHKKD